MTLEQLKRVRWFVRCVLVLGLAASAVANGLHAQPNWISRSISAWPVLALYLTIELISRVPVHGWLTVARITATAVIASIAAFVSYWHMAGVALRYGETSDAAHLLPLSVDGLIVVASICLVELGGRIRTAEDAPAAQAVPAEYYVGPVYDYGRPIGPMPVPIKARSGTAGGDDSTAQRGRADERTAQQKEALVRAVKAAIPDASLRTISAFTLVPVSTVRTILNTVPAQANGNVPDLEEAGVGG